MANLSLVRTVFIFPPLYFFGGWGVSKCLLIFSANLGKFDFFIFDPIPKTISDHFSLHFGQFGTTLFFSFFKQFFVLGGEKIRNLFLTNFVAILTNLEQLLTYNGAAAAYNGDAAAYNGDAAAYVMEKIKIRLSSAQLS